MELTRMSATDNRVLQCEYCGRFNPPEGARCIGCGAPLVLPAPRQVTVTVNDAPSTPPPPAVPLEQELKDAAKAAGAGLGLLGVGTVLLRLGAEVVAIAVAAYIIGMNAGGSAAGLNNFIPHLITAAIAGALLGLCVSLVAKRVIWTLLSAPAGAIIGNLAAMALPLPHAGFPLGALTTAAGAILLALLGGRRPRGMPLRYLNYLRPVLGVLGGLLFALLGFAVAYRIY